MPLAEWPLRTGRPVVQVTLSLAGRGQRLVRRLVADTGAGTLQSVFELLLDEEDCLQCGGIPIQPVQLGGAYTGWYPVYLVDVRVPELNFDDSVPVVGVPNVPEGLDGIAAFKFLCRFNYGNFGDSERFGLDPPPTP
ncbi:MAG: hypothetical protein H8E44_02125 [Planctomycetes bacterium]|nr:hypothetical protein [Planctomycetota bacterium]